MLLRRSLLLIDWLRHPAQGRARPWLLGLALWLCLMQWFTPTLGLMHQVLHHGGSAMAASIDGAEAEQESPAPMFDGHSSADCQLFDQIALGLALLAPPMALALVPALRKAAWSVQALLLRQSPALFFARGPPL